MISAGLASSYWGARARTGAELVRSKCYFERGAPNPFYVSEQVNRFLTTNCHDGVCGRQVIIDIEWPLTSPIAQLKKNRAEDVFRVYLETEPSRTDRA